MSYPLNFLIAQDIIKEIIASLSEGGISALFIYFAFSLFGHYEIQIPSTLRQFSVKQEERGGVLGILFMALTFTLTSFTCTVQFVGLLLVAASQGEFFWPILGMITFSTAFASPFFFLALFPQ